MWLNLSVVPIPVSVTPESLLRDRLEPYLQGMQTADVGHCLTLGWASDVGVPSHLVVTVSRERV